MIKTTSKNTITQPFQSPPENFRYERKFTINNTHRNNVLYYIKMNPAFFREIFVPRQINNIYFETPNFQFYKANEIGLAERKKVRIRWYGDIFGKIEKPVLELKIKHGLVGDKWSWKIPSFDLNENFTVEKIYDGWKNSNLPPSILEELLVLQPTLLNSYQRTYFLSADKKFRLTLDEKMSYQKISTQNNQFLEKHETPNNFIVELKYTLESDKNVSKISQHFPFRMDKSSKYMNGIDWIYD